MNVGTRLGVEGDDADGDVEEVALPTLPANLPADLTRGLALCIWLASFELALAAVCDRSHKDPSSHMRSVFSADLGRDLWLSGRLLACFLDFNSLIDMLAVRVAP